MNRARTFLGGIFAALSLTAAPAFADSPRAEARFEQKAELRFERRERAPVRYDERLEAKVLELVNAERVRRGLPKLKADQRGTVAARQASAEASREGNFASLEDRVDERLGEQGIKRGFEMGELTRVAKDGDLEAEAKKIVKAWMKDKKQAKVLLDEDFTYAGVGAVSRGGKLFVTFDAFGPQKVKPIKPPKAPKPVNDC